MRVLAVSLLLAACGPADISAATRNLASSSDADAGSGAPTVTFYGPPTWTYAASALLVPGAAETLQYDLSRLSQCQATTPWTLTAFFSADGAPATSQSVSSTTLATGATSVELPFEVPFATDLAFWFEIQSAGCQAWDSNYGNNFHYQVQAPTTPVIHFNADFTQTVQGTLVAGQPITIDYALSRLPNCRGTYGANPAWAVTLNATADGVALPDAELTTSLLGQLIGAPAIVTPPAGAQKLTLWFQNTDVDGCNQWDSNYGQNFAFSL